LHGQRGALGDSSGVSAAGRRAAAKPIALLIEIEKQTL
jgi:hypothetical protein